MNKSPLHKNHEMNWLYDEYITGVGLSYQIEGILSEVKTKYQRIKVVKTRNLGVVLIINDWIYRTEDMGNVMPEMIVHVPMNVGNTKKRVLLIGGGDGYSLSELIKYREIELIDVVDIDEQMVSLCKKYFTVAKKAFADKRVNIHISEGSQFVKKQNRYTYDLVLVTGTEPYDSDGKPGISYPLFQPDFYENCIDILTDNGIFLTDGQMGYYGGDYYKKVIQDLNLYFPIVKPYIVTSKYIPGGMYVINVATKVYDPEINIRECFVPGLTYYSIKMHRSSFTLPQFLI